jgi:hypothetical protein
MRHGFDKRERKPKCAAHLSSSRFTLSVLNVLIALALTRSINGSISSQNKWRERICNTCKRHRGSRGCLVLRQELRRRLSNWLSRCRRSIRLLKCCIHSGLCSRLRSHWRPSTRRRRLSLHSGRCRGRRWYMKASLHNRPHTNRPLHRLIGLGGRQRLLILSWMRLFNRLLTVHDRCRSTRNRRLLHWS